MAHTEIVEENDDDNELSEGTQTSDVDRVSWFFCIARGALKSFWPDKDTRRLFFEILLFVHTRRGVLPSL